MNIENNCLKEIYGKNYRTVMKTKELENLICTDSAEYNLKNLDQILEDLDPVYISQCLENSKNKKLMQELKKLDAHKKSESKILKKDLKYSLGSNYKNTLLGYRNKLEFAVDHLKSELE